MIESRYFKITFYLSQARNSIRDKQYIIKLFFQKSKIIDIKNKIKDYNNFIISIIQRKKKSKIKLKKSYYNNFF
jgi:hypothetical protein